MNIMKSSDVKTQEYRIILKIRLLPLLFMND